MFFIMGINDGRKDLEYSQMAVCAACGAYGRYRVFMTFTALSLFFIPVFRWNRRYYVQASCCGAVFELDAETGRRIAAGEEVEIRDEDLHPAGGRAAGKRCANCGYATDQDFDFCPKCGRRF